MIKSIFSMMSRGAAASAFVVVAVVAVVLAGCDSATKKSAADVAREDFYSSMGVREGESQVRFLEAKVDSALAPYDEAELFELVSQVGELNGKLKGIELAFLMDSVEVEKLSKMTAHMAADEVDNFMKRQKKYAEQKGKVDSLRTMIKERTMEVAKITNTQRGFCGYKVTAKVNDEAGREQTLVFLTDKGATKVLLKMMEADYDEMQRIIKGRMAEVQMKN